MGNRGNVVFATGEQVSPTVYLHWNGGPESVYAFLAELDRREVRVDAMYEAARFVQLVGEFFDYSDGVNRTGLSLGITNPPGFEGGELDLAKVFTDAGDNGFYVVDRSHADGPKIRRFVESDWDPEKGPSFRELTPDEVEAEKNSDNVASYAESIAGFFAKLDERLS